MKEIVTADWLNNNLNNPRLIMLDASVENPVTEKNVKAYECTIPNSRRFDLENIFIDKESYLPNTIPTPLKFEDECRKLGINQNSEIVVYDNRGVFTSPRAWWLFNLMGHEKIAVLDGGLPNWVECGFRTEEKHITTFDVGNFKSDFNKELVINFEQIKDNIILDNFLIVDARPKGRFTGSENEPREYLQSGNIKGSVNIPHEEVLNNFKFKSKDKLHKLFEKKCNGRKDIVFSCGSGMAACIIMLASRISYANSKKIYDGSWTEWAERNGLKT